MYIIWFKNTPTILKLLSNPRSNIRSWTCNLFWFA